MTLSVTSSQARCHSSSVRSAAPPYGGPPMLVTSTSRPPSCSTVVATTRSQSAADVTSAWIGRMRAPVRSVNSAAAASSASMSRPKIATAAPSVASTSAVARPSPRPPPPTSATLSARPRSIVEPDGTCPGRSHGRIVLGLLALIAFPVQAGATTTDECQAQITSLRADTAATVFVNAKDQAGLLGKLDAASAALTAGKSADAIRKLTDFGTKVQALGSTGKLGTEDADRL